MLSLACLVLAALGAPCKPVTEAASAEAASSWVTCGSTIKLAHGPSGYRLHSQRIPYSRGSRQQSVTAFPLDRADSESYWVVHGSKDKPCRPGHPVSKKQEVRLQHAASRKWLHSHAGYSSPLSGNQEVSVYGSDHQSDGGDVWVIDWSGKAKFWQQDAKVTLQHAGTKGFLHSYKHAAFGHPISGQREVCAVARGAKESEWFAAEGVYMPRADEPAGQQWRPQQRQGQQQQQSAGKAAPGKAGSAPSKAGAGAPRKGEPSNCTASTCDARDEL